MKDIGSFPGEPLALRKKMMVSRRKSNSGGILQQDILSDVCRSRKDPLSKPLEVDFLEPLKIALEE